MQSYILKDVSVRLQSLLKKKFGKEEIKTKGPLFENKKGKKNC